MARQRSDAELIYFWVAQGLASLLSGHFWGKFADWSSRVLMLVCALAAGLLGVVLFFTDLLQNRILTPIGVLLSRL